MFPPIPPIINVDMIYQIQPNPYVSFGFNPNTIIQQMPQQNPFLSQLIHTQQQLINNQIFRSASMLAQHQQLQQQQHQQISQQHQSSLPTSSTTEINDQTTFQQEMNFGSTIKFATWNVRGAIEMDKRNAIDKCLNDKLIEIACIQETKLQMTNLDTTNYKWHFISKKNDHNYHCGTAILVKHSYQAAVSNFEAVTGNILSCFVRTKELTILVISAHFTEDLGNEIEFERLKNFLKLYESLPTIILGDFNAQLGKSDIIDEDYVFMGTFLYHDKCNNNGRLLKDLASEAKLFIKNTFRSHKINKWRFILTTCRLKDKTSTSKAEEAQIDHVLVSRNGIVFVKMLRGYYRNNIQTDHKMIVADVEIRNFDSEHNDHSEVIDLSQEDDVVAESSQNQDSRINVDGMQDLITESPTSNQKRYSRRKLKRLRSKEIVRDKQKHQADNRTDTKLQSTQTQEPTNYANNCESLFHIDRGDLQVSINNTNIEDVEMQISPGEPVPPGFEDVVKPVAELQVILSKYRTAPLIGLEYIIELIMGERRPRTYHCALCDKICDTKDIIEHITSYDHRCKYLEKHFCTVMSMLSQYRHQKNAKDVLASVIEEVCDSIEVAYGRMVPCVFENNDYTTNRAIYMKKLAKERHFDEKSGSTFAGVIDHKAIQSAFETLAHNLNIAKERSVVKKTRVETVVRSKRNSFDSISSSESIPTSVKKTKHRAKSAIEPVIIDQINLDLISSDEDESAKKKRKKSSSPRRSAHASSYSKNDETEEFKYERYRSLAQQAVEDLSVLLKEYEKYPEKHPLYPSEWNRYWLRRSEQLKGVGVDPRSFDFSSEWSKYWLRRMRELYDEDVALKKFEIRKKLDLSSDFYPKSSSSNCTKISSSSTPSRSDESRMTSRQNVDKIQEDIEDEPLTVISVLRLLTAFEDLLGASLGPKVVDLLSKAVALEKVKANLADDLLMTEENSVLLDTIKEKLKGLIIADVLKSQQINAVRRAIRNVTSIVTVIDKKISAQMAQDRAQSHKTDKSDVANVANKMWTEKSKPQPRSTQIKNNVQKVDDSRTEVCKQIATAFLIQKINISNEILERLTDIYMSKSSSTTETPYLFGVHVSQKFQQNNGITDYVSSKSQSSSSRQSQFQQQNNSDAGSSFAFNLFQNNDRNADRNSSENSSNSSNFLSRSNTINNQADSYSQYKSSTQCNLNQSNQMYRSQDNSQCNSFSHQNSTHPNASSFNNSTNIQSNNNQQNQQRNFQQQNITKAQQSQQHPQLTNHLMNNQKNHFNLSNQRNQCQVQIWDSKPIMTNQSKNKFDKSSNIDNIWETNPLQNQQQFNQTSFQRHKNATSVWDHQFQHKQNNRNNRR